LPNDGFSVIFLANPNPDILYLNQGVIMAHLIAWCPTIVLILGAFFLFALYIFVRWKFLNNPNLTDQARAKYTLWARIFVLLAVICLLVAVIIGVSCNCHCGGK
jgi:hypothetical protein